MGQSAIDPTFLQNDKLANPELGEETLQSPSSAEEKGISVPQTQPMLCRVSFFFLYVCYMCVFPHCPTPNKINTFLHLLILFAVLEISPLLPVALEIFHAF